MTICRLSREPGVHLREPPPDRDRAGRPGRGELHEADLVTHRLVVIDDEADLLVERLGHVDVGHGHHDQFEFHVHAHHGRAPRGQCQSSVCPLLTSSSVPPQLATMTDGSSDPVGMETRRIALVTEKFYPAVDGTTTTLKQVADHLIDAGHEVLIVAPGPGLGTYRRSHVARIRPLDKPGRQVREALEKFDPDLVHVTSPGHARPQGAQARSPPRRPHPRRAALDPAARAEGRPGRGDVRLPRRAADRASASRLPSGSQASTPAPSTPTCATSGCTTSGRAPAPATAARSWSAMPAACTSVTAYAAWRSSQTSPGSASS